LHKPIQRLDKYPTLLKEFIKCNEINPMDHPKLLESSQRWDIIVDEIGAFRGKVETGERLKDLELKISNWKVLTIHCLFIFSPYISFSDNSFPSYANIYISDSLRGLH